ncbi:response regulator transcription factor [Thalassobaculum sp.]|uniref:response regulator transcription factor n=1 Tax=Thalassobaculum sp. TaxID=2022740 RepID=UPI0032EE7668
MRILLIDDHVLVSESLALSLKATGTALETITVDRVDRAIDVLKAGSAFDFMIMDWRMPGLSGAEAIADLRDAAPGIPVVVCSGDEDPAIASAAVSAGARGFLPKTMPVQQLAAAIQLIAKGAVYIPPELSLRAAARPDTTLTERELEVVRGLIQGKSNKELGRELDLAEVTVKLHVRRAMKKLEVVNRTQAALKARELGLG